MEVLQVLMDPILPVFAIMAFGFAMGRMGKTSVEDARLLNRTAMAVFLPVLIFGLIANAPIKTFSVTPILIYALSQIVVFTIGFMLAYRLFKREAGEALLLGFGGVFVNNALYILPISVLLYGEDSVLPITSIITLDAIFAFSGAIIALQIINLGKVTLPTVAFSLVKSPLLQAIFVGAIIGFLGINIPAPIQTFINFTGSAAAPVALFALGVVMSQTQLRPTKVVITFTMIKLLVFPAIIWLGLEIFATNDPGRNLFLLGSAGPAGAMSFSLAMLHNIRTDAIAQIIIWTSILTLISLAILA
ncbi:MAG: AEC family transporter [Rhizobiales bacterium]|nr:AEC family transporter [Hyphomicrobiales bacterium]